MLLTKKFAGLLGVFGSVLIVQAFNAPQHVFTSNVDTQGFRILQNDVIDGYSVRIKQPESCEEGVQYSGYIDKHDTDDHFFFYFFESRNDPANDPTVLWLNGGPGCSSMMGLWMELGPCRVNEFGNGTDVNPFSWNTASNIFFVDQPVNVGYSYGKTKVATTAESARNVYAFLQLFLSEFSEYADSPFHISGESYGGHYLPGLSTEIIRNNKVAEEKGYLKINYESVLIGNGWTDSLIQYRHFETYSCAHDSHYKPIYDEETCAGMRKALPHCEKLISACYDYPSALTCLPANLYCEKTQAGPYTQTGLNPYDIRVPCKGDSGLCYDLIDAIKHYANDEDTRAALGVDQKAGHYESCSDSVASQFHQQGDKTRDYSGHIIETLDAGIRVLIYVGDMDWICNWYGNLAWTKELEWYGKKEYNAAEVQDWYSQLSGKYAGQLRSYDKLTFLRVFDAGHMVPYDQPEHALDMFANWLNNSLTN